MVHHLFWRKLARLDFQLLGLNFREIEDIADDLQQQPGRVVHRCDQAVNALRQLFGLQQVEVTDNPVQRGTQLMADGGEEHRFRLARLLRRLRHLLQGLFHFDARTHVHQHADRYVFVAVARVNEADLQVGIVAGQHVDEVNLLAADNLRQTLTILVGQHIEIVMRQFVTQDVSAVLSTQNTDPHRCRGDNFAVELLVLFKAQRIGFSR